MCTFLAMLLFGDMSALSGSFATHMSCQTIARFDSFMSDLRREPVFTELQYDLFQLIDGEVVSVRRKGAYIYLGRQWLPSMEHIDESIHCQRERG